MIEQLRFTEQELELLAELLEAQRRELPVEIHHTDALRVKALLRKRLRAVDRLIERVGYARAEAAQGDKARSGNPNGKVTGGRNAAKVGTAAGARSS
jgi:hypothetical protein